jgi:hypothetical protein
MAKPTTSKLSTGTAFRCSCTIAVSRYRRPGILLALLQLGLWYPVSLDLLAWPKPPVNAWLLAGGSVSAAI